MFRVLANNTDPAFAPKYLAIFANFFNTSPNFHKLSLREPHYKWGTCEFKLSLREPHYKWGTCEFKLSLREPHYKWGTCELWYAWSINFYKLSCPWLNHKGWFALWLYRPAAGGFYLSSSCLINESIFHARFLKAPWSWRLALIPALPLAFQ